MKTNFKALLIMLIYFNTFSVVPALENARYTDQRLTENSYKNNGYYYMSVALGHFLFPQKSGNTILSNKLAKLIAENKTPADKVFLSNFLQASGLNEPEKAHLICILESIVAETNYELAVLFWAQAIDILTKKQYYKNIHPFYLKDLITESEKYSNNVFPTWHPLKQIIVLEGPIFGPLGAINFLELAYGIEPTSEISMAISSPPEVKAEPSYFASLTTNLSSLASSTKKLLYHCSSDSDSEHEAAKKPIVKKD